MKCFCGSGKEFNECCEQPILGKTTPAYPEELMRSRYSAYVTGDIDYIIKTTLKSKQKDLNKDELEQWAKSIKWLSLQIIEAEPPLAVENRATVEFIAKYAYGETAHNHHELSTFVKEDGKWYFSDAKFLEEEDNIV